MACTKFSSKSRELMIRDYACPKHFELLLKATTRSLTSFTSVSTSTARAEIKNKKSNFFRSQSGAILLQTCTSKALRAYYEIDDNCSF